MYGDVHVNIMNVEQGVVACMHCEMPEKSIISGKPHLPATHFNPDIKLKKADDVA